MATFGRLRSLRHERPICRKFPGWNASGTVGLVLFLARLVPDLAIAQSEAGYARAGELLLAKPARQSCFSVGVGARQWREIRTIYLRVHLAAGGYAATPIRTNETGTVLKGALCRFRENLRRIEARRDSHGAVCVIPPMGHTMLRPRRET
jgi:hypothetical protein